MAGYEYKCDACGTKFEFTQDPNNPVRPKCPNCQSEKTRRVFSGSGRISTNKPSAPSSGKG